MNLKEKWAAQSRTKSFRYGSRSVLVSLMLIVIVLLVNVLVGLLPTKATEFDITENGLYSLSELTETYVKNLDSEITIYVIAQTGTEDALVEETLKRYTTISSKIHYEYIDPILQPSFVEKYTKKQLSNGSLIMVSDKYPDRPYVLDYADLSYRAYSDQEKQFLAYAEALYGSDAILGYKAELGVGMYDAEKQITTGLSYVTTDKLPHIYVIAGHGGSGYASSLAESFAMANVVLESLDLATVAEIPADADAWILHDPNTDLSEEEVKLLSKYLEQGGTLLLSTNYKNIASLTNLSAVLAEYGLSGSSDLILETGGDYCYYDSTTGKSASEMLIPLYASDHPFTNAFSLTTRLCYPNAHRILISGSKPATVSVTQFLYTSAKARLYDVDSGEYTDTEEKETGNYPLAVDAKRMEDLGVSSRVIWFSSTAFFSSNANSISGGANYSYYMTAISELTGADIEFAIEAISMDVGHLTVSTPVRIVLTVVLAVLIPGALIAVGCVIYVKRRKH